MRGRVQPVLLAIDDDETLLGDIERELHDRYARHLRAWSEAAAPYTGPFLRGVSRTETSSLVGSSGAPSPAPCNARRRRWG